MTGFGPRLLGTGPGRHRAGWDLALSVALLVISYAVYWIAFVFAFLQLSLLAPCTSAGCATAQAGNVQFLAALVLFLIGVLGTTGVVVLQVGRRRSWWAAAAMIVLTLGGWILASVLFQASLPS